MVDKLWKACEREIAKWFPGARRRGADFRGENAGKSDLVCPGYSIEIKSLQRPTYGQMVGAVKQSEDNRSNPNEIPLAIIHKVNDRYADALVVMRLETFSDFFINSADNES